MAKSITVPLSKSGIDKAATWLEDYARRTLPKNCVDLISRMCRTGEVWAMTLMNHIDTGNTLSTIRGYRNGNKGVIVANGAAIWIEFGTGVVANKGSKPHPKAAELGMSPWGTYGKGHGASFNGWWYRCLNSETRILCNRCAFLKEKIGLFCTFSQKYLVMS